MPFEVSGPEKGIPIVLVPGGLSGWVTWKIGLRALGTGSPTFTDGLEPLWVQTPATAPSIYADFVSDLGFQCRNRTRDLVALVSFNFKIRGNCGIQGKVVAAKILKSTKSSSGLARA